MSTHYLIVRENWIFIAGGVFLLVNAFRGLKTRSTTLIYRTVRRSEDESLYWLTIWGSLALGIGAVLAVVATHGAIDRDWFFLVGSVFFLLSALNELKTGIAFSFSVTVKRSEDAFGYWSAIWFTVLLGTGGLLIVCYDWWPRRLFSW